MGTQVQNFIRGISESRKDSEFYPGEQVRWDTHRRKKKHKLGAKEEEDAGTQYLVHNKHLNIC